MNLPTLFEELNSSGTLVAGGKRISITYDGSGAKLKKTTSGGTASENYTQYYLGGIEYRDGLPEAIYHGEGRVYNTSTTTTPTWRYEYAIRDHLGNTRLMFADLDGNGVVGSTEVLQENHYYPFGMNMEGMWLNNLATKDSKYTYNGKEMNEDFGLNWMDYGARWYIPDIGRFGGIDPLAGSMAGWSPYSYTFNNPLRYTDPTGMAPFDDHLIRRDGTIISTKTNDSYDRFFVQCSDGSTKHYATLEKNNEGLVNFPNDGDGFNRYGQVDQGGFDPNKNETRGNGDHYIKPEGAAALFGLSAELADKGITIAYGDMSSSNGSDPGTGTGMHHSGHGHKGKREGLDVDFRYITKDGQSFKDGQRGPITVLPNGAKVVNDMASPNFSRTNNQLVYDTAEKYGFTKNYQGSSGSIKGVKVVGGHSDHGHLGLNYGDLKIQYIPSIFLRRN